jgi:DNA-binding transcriptional MerR regulator
MNMSVNRPIMGVKEIGLLLGVPRRQITLLVEQGIINPSFGTHGRGTARLFSAIEIADIYIALDMKSVGISPLRIRGYIISEKSEYMGPIVQLKVDREEALRHIICLIEGTN